jgi:hypothetical protein
VGAVVTLDGAGCRNPGQPTYLVFEGTGFGDGHFHLAFTIPAELHSLQGRGGGSVRPGTYDFVSKPVLCSTPFAVAAS